MKWPRRVGGVGCRPTIDQRERSDGCRSARWGSVCGGVPGVSLERGNRGARARFQPMGQRNPRSLVKCRLENRRVFPGAVLRVLGGSAGGPVEAAHDEALELQVFPGGLSVAQSGVEYTALAVLLHPGHALPFVATIHADQAP